MSGTRLIRIEIAADPPPRLDKALAQAAPDEAELSRSQLVRLIAEGAVSRGGLVVTELKTRSTEGEVFDISINMPADLETMPEAIPLHIAYEDAALIVVNKPAGMVVHPAPGSPSGTLVNALLHHCADSLSGIGGRKRPGIVHRIDKDTSGLLVVAKSDAAHRGLAAQFEKHSVDRRYLALAYGVPDAGDPRLTGLPGVGFEPGNTLRITTNLARHKTDRQRQAVVNAGGRHAITRARLLERFGTPPVLSLLECRLETGRTHQIRVHLAHVGHALVGDAVYGGRRRFARGAFSPEIADDVSAFPRQALHAAHLGFVHPVSGETLSFDAEPPADMRVLVDSLRA